MHTPADWWYHPAVGRRPTGAANSAPTADAVGDRRGDRPGTVRGRRVRSVRRDATRERVRRRGSVVGGEEEVSAGAAAGLAGEGDGAAVGVGDGADDAQ